MPAKRLGFAARNRDFPQNTESCTIRRINDGAAIRTPGQSRDRLVVGRQTPCLTSRDWLKINVGDDTPTQRAKARVCAAPGEVGATCPGAIGSPAATPPEADGIPPAITSRNVCPSSNSMAINGWPSCSPNSYTVQMLG